MEISENKGVSVTVQEEFNKELLHSSHIGVNTPVFTISSLPCGQCEVADSSVTKTTSLTISACLLNSNSSVDSSKAAPFYPRVVVGTQSSASSIDPTRTFPVPPESESYSQQQTQSQLHPLTTFGGQANSVANPQLYPLILTAASATSNHTTNTLAPIHVQVANNTEGAVVSTNSSITSPVGVPISTLSLSTVTNANRISSSASSVTSCSVITPTESRGPVSSTGHLAPVVISPQLATSISPAFTLRFTPPTSLHCGSLTSIPNNSTLFETPVLSSHLTPISQQSHAPAVVTTSDIGAAVTISTAQSTLTSTNTPAVSLLMSSGLCPPSRVLIHKSAGLTTLNPGVGPTTGLSESFPLTLVTPGKTNDIGGSTAQTNACATISTNSNPSVPISTSGAPGQSPLNTPTKAKLVSLTTPVSASVRLFTTSTTTVPYSTKATGTSGIYTASISNAFSNATVISPVKTGCTGLWTNLSGSNGVTANSLVALQPAQPLLVHAAPDLAPVSPNGTTSSSQISFASSRPLASVAPGVSTHNTAPISLNTPTVPPTVLAFSLSTTTPSSINVSGAGVLTQTGSGVRPGTVMNPLVVRGGCVSAVTNASTTCSTVSSVATLTSASLLKPFSLSVPASVSPAPSYLYTSVHSSVVTPSAAATVPHVVPISIAPARLPSISTGLTTPPSPAISTGPMRSPLHSAICSCILSPRHHMTSVFSSTSNRKRARKQQLAGTSVTTASTISSTGTSGLAVISNSAPIAISQSTVCTSSNNPTTIPTVPFCNNSPQISIAHFTPIPGRSGQVVTPTIVAIPKPVIQPAPSSGSSALPIQPLTALSPRPSGFSTVDPLQIKVPNSGLLPTTSATTCSCFGALNTISMATPPTSTAGGYVGIRLLSVRPNPTSLTQPCSTGLVTTPAQLGTLPTNVPGLITRLSTGSTVNCASEVIPTTISGTCGSGVQHLRLATCATTPEVTHTQAATVYVLTTSNAYPVLSSCTSSSLSNIPTSTSTTSDPHSSTGLPFATTSTAAVTTTTPSYGTALMMPGMGPGVVQVRFRPPLTVTTTTISTVTLTSSGATGNTSSAAIGSISTPMGGTTTSPLVLDARQSGRLSGSSHSCVTPTTTGSGESSATKAVTTTALDSTIPKTTPLRPSTSFTSSSSLLHRHLLSPQNPVHNEQGTAGIDDRSLDSGVDLDNPTVANSVELFTAATTSTECPVSGDQPAPVTSVSATPFRNQDIEFHCSGRLKHNAYGYHRTVESQVRITAAADMATEGMTRLDGEEKDDDDEDLRNLTNTKLKVSEMLRLPRKRFKLDETVKLNDQFNADSQQLASLVDDEQLLILLKSKSFSGKHWPNHNNSASHSDVPAATIAPVTEGPSSTSYSTTVRLTIDPVSGCEWVLNGFPAKPSMIPRWMNPNVRSSGAWRAKSTHFLTCSEVRNKPDSKWDHSRRMRRDLSGKLSFVDDTFAGSSRRHRRRALSRRSSLDRTSEDSSANSSAYKQPNSTVGNVDFQLLQEIVALREQQSERQFVQFPLTHVSVLNVSGWRMLSCTDNLDLLVYSEHRSLQALDSLHFSLQDWSGQVATRDGNRSPSFSQILAYSAGSQETYEIDRTSCTHDFLQNDGPKSPGALSTSTISSVSSMKPASVSMVDTGLKTEIEKAVDLILGICQRKRCLMDSLQRLHNRSRRLVEQFRADALSFFDDIEQEPEDRDVDVVLGRGTPLSNSNICNDAPPASPPSSTSTKASGTAIAAAGVGGGSGRNTPSNMRRSTRTSSPGGRHHLKRIRRRDIAAETEEPRVNSKSTAGAGCLLNTSCTKSTSLCNGELDNPHGHRR